MYWSHPKTDKTIIYGFGVNKIPDPDYETSKKKEKEEAGEALLHSINNYFSCCKNCGLLRKVISKMFKSCFGTNIVEKELGIVPNEMDQEDSINFLYELKKIPLFKFVFRLLNTYMYANDHLIYECFEKEVFHTHHDLLDPKIF